MGQKETVWGTFPLSVCQLEAFLKCRKINLLLAVCVALKRQFICFSIVITFETEENVSFFFFYASQFCLHVFKLTPSMIVFHYLLDSSFRLLPSFLPVLRDICHPHSGSPFLFPPPCQHICEQLAGVSVSVCVTVGCSCRKNFPFYTS